MNNWTDHFPGWPDDHKAKWRKKLPCGPSADRALSSILGTAHHLALLSRIGPRDILPRDLKHCADRLLADRDELQLALHINTPPAPIIVQPAPRSVCLHCGAPYEEVA